MKKINLIIASFYSISLVFYETIMNIYWSDWDFFPLWIIDYLIALTLILAVFFFKNKLQNIFLLIGWCLSFGVTYMAFFISVDPNGLSSPDIESKLPLMASALIVSAFGLILTLFDIFKNKNSFT
tara:strand:+ start:713 stop:1087 length:375 start_codon:yes stop_codon:yes gene_type:complete